LDTRSNITGWEPGKYKEFTVTNTKVYNKYRINITANRNSKYTLTVSEVKMMETVTAPTDLNAIGGAGNIKLTWNGVANAQSYVIKRSITSGGTPDTVIPFTPVVTGSALEYIDSNVTPGTTYYYVVNAIISGNTSSNFLSNVSGYSDNNISSLDFYNSCSDAETYFQKASTSFNYGANDYEKNYLSVFETVALSDQLAAQYLMKYIDTEKTSHLSKAQEYIQRAKDGLIMISQNRSILLADTGLTQDEIKEKVEKDLLELDAE